MIKASQTSAAGRIPQKWKDKEHHIDWNKALEDVDTARSRTVEYIGQALLDKYYLDLRDPRVIYEVGRWLKERTGDTLHLNAFKSPLLVDHGIKREDVVLPHGRRQLRIRMVIFSFQTRKG